MSKLCIVVGNIDHKLFSPALISCKRAFDDVVPIDHKEALRELAKYQHQNVDLLVSIFNEHIIDRSMLNHPNVNFHPATPAYPGRGGASRALFDCAKTYGATAHLMRKRVDSGDILRVSEFPICPDDTCEYVFDRAERECLSLLEQIVDYFRANESLPSATHCNWSGANMTRSQFDRWLVLSPENKAEFDRKIKAAKHSKYPGPYVELNGHRFAYVGESKS